MTTIINPKCPKCGNVLTIKLNMIDRLKAEIDTLRAELVKAKSDGQAMDTFKSIFGGFK